jgi:hypothetical protein
VPFLLKVAVSALLIAGISELGRRSTAAAAILASLPLTSILAMLWLYRDTGSVEKISGLSIGIFWAVLPSLLFFIVLPIFLRSGIRFTWAMLAACVVMTAGYSAYALLLRKFGVEL